MCLVGQSIHKGVPQHLVWEKPQPVARWSVRGYDDAPRVVSFGDDLVERLGLFMVEAGKPQVVNDKQVRLEEQPNGLLVCPFVPSDGEPSE